MMGRMKPMWSVAVVGAVLLLPALAKAQSADAAVTDAAALDAAATDAASADAAVGDGAVGDAELNDAMADAEPGINPPSPSDPGDPDYTRGGGPLDPMQTDVPPYVEPTYAGREAGAPHSEPPAARSDATEPDHSQTCGCRFVGSDQPSAAALLGPLLAFLLLARRILQSV